MIYDECTPDLQLSGETYAESSYTYDIGDSWFSIQVPAFSSNDCNGVYAKVVYAPSDDPTNFVDVYSSSYFNLVDNRVFTKIKPYTNRFTQTGNMVM